jgi:hypothetical protein
MFLIQKRHEGPILQENQIHSQPKYVFYRDDNCKIQTLIIVYYTLKTTPYHELCKANNDDVNCGVQKTRYIF